MYQVLYRKWRPKQFSDVYGQPHITSALKNAVEKNRISHAYLFTGSRGTGKTTCAKILAKAVNCLHPKDGDPCNECEICRGIDNGSVLDIVEIDAASNNGVDNIRELREETNYTPANTKYRVYIIDEVHMLSIGAFNALLKTLEEPPSYVIFILATTEVHKIPATILSRCQRFDFRRISPEDIADRLTFVAEQEGKSLERAAALLIARLADGALRDALSILDLCMEGDTDINEKMVSKAAGLADRDYLYQLSEAIAGKDSSAALNLIAALHNASCDMQRLCTELLALFRNYLIFKTTHKPAAIVIASTEELKRMEACASGFPTGTVIRNMEILQKSLQNISFGADRRMELEIAIVRMCAPELQTDVGNLLTRIEALERGSVPVRPVTAGSTNEAAKPFEPEPVQVNMEQQPAELPPTVPPEIQPAKNEESIEAFTLWEEVLDALKNTNGMLFSMLQNSNAYLRNGSMVVIEPSDVTFAEIVKKDNNSAVIKGAIKQVSGKAYRLAVSKPKNAPKTKKQKGDPLEDFLKQHAEDVTLH